MCPCGSGLSGQCCCGCIQNGFETTTTCPSTKGWARVEGPAEDYLPFPDTPKYLYARRNPAYKYANPATVIPDTPNRYRTTAPFKGPNYLGTKRFGEPCNASHECMGGMCGTGCDCPSEKVPVCSCECLCNFPSKCCCGCFVGTDPELQTCPYPGFGVNYSYEVFRGPSPFVFPSGNQALELARYGYISNGGRTHH